jgi:transposase
VLLLMTHPGVGPITGLVFVLVIGTSERFLCGKQIGGYIGLIPSEDSSAGRQRLGHISKQGNAMLRYLLGEASQAAVQPKAVRDGDTLATPITAKERSKIDKSIKKKYDGFRRRYPEVHGKVVDFITHPIEDGTLYFNLS